MKFSLELEILIESIKVVLLEKSSNRLSFLLKNEQIDWKRLEKLATFHAVRPVVYEALKRVNFENVSPKFKEYLSKKYQEISLFNLIIQNEYNFLSKVFDTNSIRFIPYKGVFWQNNIQRESGDLDILVHNDDFIKSCELLIENEYLEKNINSNDIKQVQDHIKNVKERGDIELAFIKKNNQLKPVEIDLHWTINNNYSFVEFEAKQIFDFEEDDARFWLIILHNGGKEAWHRLKYICDYLVFLKNHHPNWRESLIQSDKYKVHTLLNSSNFIVENFFEFPLQYPEKSIELKTIQSIITAWEFATRYELSAKARYLYEKSKMLQMDKSSSRWKYFYGIIKYQSLPDARVKDRFITFPKNYPILNFISKFISFLIKKAF